MSTQIWDWRPHLNASEIEGLSAIEEHLAAIDRWIITLQMKRRNIAVLRQKYVSRGAARAKAKAKEQPPIRSARLSTGYSGPQAGKADEAA